VSDVLELSVERPVAGGRMLARHEGRVVFVAGAIPGERIRARVDRSVKKTLFATTVEVLEASPDRRQPLCDPACGGLAFAYIQYERQRELKAEILTDAFRRLAHLTLPAPVSVAASPERGYRLRARLHVRDGRAGFFREGTHSLCDAGATAQLLPASLDAVAEGVASLGERAGDCEAIAISENVAATERALHFEARPGRTLRVNASGPTTVSDSAASLFGAEPPIDPGVIWTRKASSFFQGNRFLTGSLVRRVLALSDGDRCVDLYSGVGLFAVALAAVGKKVLAVEGETSSAEDLAANAAPWRDRLRVLHGAVETAISEVPEPPPDVVVVDPPRTGLSPAALRGIARWAPPRLVYVSCDPPTLARDAAQLSTHGFVLESLDGFDLFPNTTHVEAVACFVHARSS